MSELAMAKVNETMKIISDALGVEIRFAQDNHDQGRVIPIYNPDAILSKLFGLFIYAGGNISVATMPSYTRVHADIEWWKAFIAAATAAPAEPEALTSDSVPADAAPAEPAAPPAEEAPAPEAPKEN